MSSNGLCEALWALSALELKNVKVAGRAGFVWCQKHPPRAAGSATYSFEGCTAQVTSHYSQVIDRFVVLKVIFAAYSPLTMISPTVSVNSAHPAIYSPLDPHRKEIRLATIHTGHTSNDIYCSLSTVSLGDKPLYDALSYTWGMTNSNVPVYVQGVPKQVATNLESVLRHLRFIDKPRTIWIDALCINQSDALEWSHKYFRWEKCTQELPMSSLG